MARTPATRILSIDPSTRSVGLSVWRGSLGNGVRPAVGKFIADHLLIPRADPGTRANFADRTTELSLQLSQIAGHHPLDLILVEIAGSYGRTTTGQAHLMYAAGSLVGAALHDRAIPVMPVYPVQWYPRRRSPKTPMKKTEALHELRKRHGDLNEHILCARGIIDWYIAHANGE